MLADKLSEWFAMSAIFQTFGRMFADALVCNNMRGAMAGLAAIVTWRHGMDRETFDITPDHAVRTVDAALDILGLGLDAPAEQPKEEKPIMADESSRSSCAQRQRPPRQAFGGHRLRRCRDVPASHLTREAASAVCAFHSHLRMLLQTQYGIPEEAVKFKVLGMMATGRLRVFTKETRKTLIPLRFAAWTSIRLSDSMGPALAV